MSSKSRHTPRAALYARFSSDRQNERSAEDQLHLCRAYTAQQGMNGTAEYSDLAISGASRINRIGLARLMRDAREHRFDVVVCESLDRLSRDQADLATIRKELTFLEIGIVTLQDGEVGAMHIGLKGLMSEMFLADLAQRTRRGLIGRLRTGATAGGKSYGYDVDRSTTGKLLVNEVEAATVRRIFAAYIAGDNSRTIASSLNRDNVPSPRGGKWNASTIHGSAARQNGILQNRLYIGEIVWNRQRFIKDPATGKRVSRLNPESEWQIVAKPELLIVERDIFARAQQILAGRRTIHPSHQRRPKHVFSGLMKCACCGAAYTIVSPGRIGCAGFRERGDCTNNRTVALAHVETRVLSALEDQLASPERVAEAIRLDREEWKRTAVTRRAGRSKGERRLAELNAAITRTVDLLVSGKAPQSLVDRLRDMEAERAAIAADLAATPDANAPIELHPAAAENYRKIVADLRALIARLKAGEPAERVVRAIRALVSEIVITPAPSKRPVGLMVRGPLATVLLASADDNSQYMGVMVAGARVAQSHISEFAA